MQQYLGISLVVIVIAMCIGILATIVSEAIFKQIEAHRRRVISRKLENAKILMETFAKYLDKYGKSVKDIVETCKKADEEGIKMNKEITDSIFAAASKAAKDAVDETEYERKK